MQTAAIAASASGDNTIVAAVSGKRIKVVAFHLSFSAPVNAKWKSGAGTDLSGLYYGGTATSSIGEAAPMLAAKQQAHFETERGEALVLNLSGAVPVGGHVLYEIGE